ncbi:hypothetical protein QQ045_023649 [Rhodiola kirilowii]
MAEEGPSRRLKKLDAIKTPPLLKTTNQVPVPVATPTRKKKKDCPAVPVRHTLTRKAKKLPTQALPDSKPPLPEKQRKTTTTSHNPRPEKQRKTTTTSSQPPPAQNPPEAQLNNHPAPTRSSPMRRPNPLLPRRSPRGLANSAGRPNPPPPEPTAPKFAPTPATIIPVLPSNSPRPPPTTISQPMPVVAPERTAPEFQPMHSFDNSSSDDDNGAEDNLANILSIRCKSDGYVIIGDESWEKRKVRGVVNGSTVASYKQTHNKGQPIKVEFLPNGTGPALQAVGSLIIHEIGSVVKDKPNFVIEKEDDQLWNYIFRKACERFREWKSNCKVFYKEYGPDATPREFLDRRDQWEWLKSHFDEPTNQEQGKKMSNEKMQAMVCQALADQNGDESEHSILDDHEPLPVATQIDIISQVIGQTRGTYVSGTGKAFKRPSLPRGGARNSHLKEQVEKQKDEF